MQLPAQTTEAAPAAGAPAKNEKDAPPPNPFTKAAREHTEKFYSRTHADFGASPIAVGPIDVPAFGYLRNVWVKVTATGGADGLATVAAAADAPWNVLSSITLEDTNGAAIVGPLTGYELYLTNLFGGYAAEMDPTLSPEFVAPTDDNDGSISWMLRIPVEISGRDALGALPNQQANATHKLRYSVAASTDVFTVAPDTLPDVTVEFILDAWTQPPAVALNGTPNMQEPPARGTVQQWARLQINTESGTQRHQIKRMGNHLRNVIFVNRVSGARHTTHFPAALRVELDGYPLHHGFDRDHWRRLMWERTGVVPPAGVFTLGFSHDLDGKAGFEMRDLWLPTTPGTRFEIEGNFGSAGTIDVLVNEVVTSAVV